MSQSWRDGTGGCRSYSPSSTSREYSPMHRGQGRGQGRVAYRGSARGNWRSVSPRDRRGARSYDSLISQEIGDGSSFDGHHDRGGRTAPPFNKQQYRDVGKGENIASESFSGNDETWSPFKNQASRGMSGRGYYHKRGQKRQREFPMGFKELERLHTCPPDAVALELLREHSGYDLLLKDENVNDGKFFLLIKVLAYATNTKSNRESLYELFTRTCEPRFMDKLCSFAMTVKRKYLDEAKEFFTHLLTFLTAYSQALTNVAIDKVPNIVDTCIAVLLHLKQQAFVSQELITKYEGLQDMLTEATQKWEKDRKHGHRERGKGQGEMEGMEPPEDFRLISVLPTKHDLVNCNRPFLRKNIVEGKYNDEKHYLDVQFRLLREDFVKPLRTGILDFRGDGKSRFKDIRVYRNVIIDGTKFSNRKMMHLVKLNLPKHIKSIENSKRLLYGNLLCFSCDNFQTLTFASVAERDAELYRKEGTIGVHFETDIEDLDFSKKFVMVESRAYFMAYKHVLKALQEMVDNGVALAPYVIHVQPNVDPPKYLGASEIYDLRVLKEMKYMKKEEACSMLIEFDDDTVELEDNVMPHMREVFVQRDLIAWPTETDLGLDSSQRRALRSALTRQLAIIQGPPGTGKTFIGLKITQILLHNSKAWKDVDRPTPILVVCFTNHALDQFLEGMTSYTNSIVRVGSRTKSEKISQFQVNRLVRSLYGTRGIPVAICEMNFALHQEVMDLERQIGSMRVTVDACRKLCGIISLDSFNGQGIIPQHLEVQLSQIGFSHWLLLSVNPEMLSKMEKQKKTTTKSTKMTAGDNIEEKKKTMESTKMAASNSAEAEKHSTIGEEEEDLVDDDEFNDAEEFLAQEEHDRQLGDDDSDNEEDPKKHTVNYEVTEFQLAEEMAYAAAACRANENNFEAAFRYNILSGQREALQIGLNLPVESEIAGHLERQPYLNLMQLDFPSRWLLYKYWTSKLEVNLLAELKKFESKYQRKSRALEEVKNQEILYIMRHASVVGMTTTGAAQYSSIMQDLAPAIVIIEEAAEILEAHVIAALTAKCQHLIMIGDHQQLRPSATVFELATKYGLDTSLFERMIKNGLAYETLVYQHRMRPAILRLLVPSIYPELKDDPVVFTYPHVKGVASDVFFINHDIPEREESDDNNSHENLHEAELMIGLCKHLMLQGYSPDQVTILTPYSGQFFLLRKLQREHAACQGVRICVVDNFQGEENDIILLSLVRSNAEGKVGFLRTDNRICVSLSRAKHGLYITGNMDLLSGSSELWKKIRSDLIRDKSFGSTLNLKCRNHPHELITIAKGSDFASKSPEGGCLRTCNKDLPNCTHSCPRVCHLDDEDHKLYKCRVPCPKILCDQNHSCPKMCFEKCTPCTVILEKVCPCGHTNAMPCHVDPEKFQCQEKVVKVLDNCQHSVKMPCYHDTKSFLCPMHCDTRLDCGHQCRLLCHRTKDPDHLNYDCKQMCTKLNDGCTQNHPCQRYCHEDCGKCILKVTKALPCGHEAQNVECHFSPESVECRMKCKKTLPCGHACKKLCYMTCDPCPVKVKKTVPMCGHDVVVACGIPPSLDMCDGNCTKTLPCGHKCLEKCNTPCTKKCKELVVTSEKCPKNHLIKKPCHLVNEVTGEDAWQYCDAPCMANLDCSHQCVGHCGSCFQGRLHVSCNKPCKRPLVCGHICQFPCSADCPPCQEMCNWKCEHSLCRKKCGLPCNFCQEPCTWKCEHQRCGKRCGEPCSVPPCQKPCPKLLKNCGHPCIGFCGDPCPPLCRICNKEELTEFTLLGFEEDADARFVTLEDCGHTIEAQGLEGWLAQGMGEIGMKSCPRCRKPIYNNRRYQKIILTTYKDVSKVKAKYFSSKTIVRRKEIELVLQDLQLASLFSQEVQQLMNNLGSNPFTSRKNKNKQKYLSVNELKLYSFQAHTLQKASEILRNAAKKDRPFSIRTLHLPRSSSILSEHEKRLQLRIKDLIKKVMEKSVIIAPQLEEEVSCELQRLMILPSYWKFLEKSNIEQARLQEIRAKLEKLMDPTSKFTDDIDKKVRELLKESEQYVGGLAITESERMMIVKAMGLKQGHWYKCPNGHVYCITECGGAMEESSCPDCHGRIGGANHRLRSDNAVATEMDGAQHGAWSNYNNLRRL
ncbi:NFX1-type zinc finger-containing protein 1-like [Macrobrachium rosenbergii]|uniref:NFX1-type zinc finger-containing protein 1-like n=1 Tax=Macrobrachium rosenbergii TaxID=79674 RepID=UPI0034D4B15F